MAFNNVSVMLGLAQFVDRWTRDQIVTSLRLSAESLYCVVKQDFVLVLPG